MGSFNNSKPTGATGTGTSFTSVSGSRGTSSVGSSAAIREVQQAMIEFEPYQTPILTRLLSTKLGKKPTGNVKFEWIQRSLLPQTDAVTLTGGAASEDNITVVDSTQFTVGSKFVVDATGEVLIVDSIASSLIDVTKVGSGNITAQTAGPIHFLGESFEQGSSSATAKSVNKDFPYNYVEIFKKAVHETESQQASVEYGPNDWDSNKAARMKEFKEQIENNLIHGIRSTATGYQNGSFTQYFTGGIYDSTANYISTTYSYAGAAPGEDWFFGTFLKGLFSKGTNKKRLYAGADLILAVNNYSKVKQQLKDSPSQKEYGVNVSSIICPFGILELTWHPMMDGLTFTKQGFAIDYGMGDTLRYRYKSGNGKNRDLQFREYGEYFKESDSRKGEWLGEVGFSIEGDEYHALIGPA